MSKSTICIMADFGDAPYAWMRSPDEPKRLVGLCIADAVDGFFDLPEIKVPVDLQGRFAEWALQYDATIEKVDFPWRSWNERGVTLARELKMVLGDRFKLEYHFQSDDPMDEYWMKVQLIE